MRIADACESHVRVEGGERSTGERNLLSDYSFLVGCKPEELNSGTRPISSEPALRASADNCRVMNKSGLKDTCPLKHVGRIWRRRRFINDLCSKPERLEDKTVLTRGNVRVQAQRP
jgi:hypothetical protein